MKVCVLGAGGLLGHMLIRVLGESFDVHGTTRESMRIESPLAKFLHQDKWIDNIDVAQVDSLKKIFDVEQFDLVINCIGLIKQRNTNVTETQMMQINAEFPHQLAKSANDCGVRLLHISTDCVFSGKKGDYCESDDADPVDIYGQSKLKGEINDSINLTLRTSHIGRELTVRKSFIEWVLSQKGKQINGYSHAIYSGLTTYELSKVIANLLQRDSLLTGLFHVSSQPISKLEIINKLNALLDLQIKVTPDSTVKIDRSLNSQKFQQATGFTINNWDKMLSDFCKDQLIYD